MKYAFSINGEDYEGEYASRQEALDEARERAEGTWDLFKGDGYTVYTAVNTPPPVAAWVESHVDSLFDCLGEEAGESVGDHAEGWLYRVKPEHEKALGKEVAKVFCLWMAEYKYEPAFFVAADVVTHSCVAGELVAPAATEA